MTETVDPREALMWDCDLRVTSEELKTYAANYPPMGVYIPRGRVKVPHLRSRRLQQIAHSARGKPNSPNLLMIRPNGLPGSTTRLPSISVYASRDTKKYDVTATMKRHQTITSSRSHVDHRRNDANSASVKATMDPMMSQYVQNNNDVINVKMADYAKSIPQAQLQAQTSTQLPIMPPPYVDPGLEKTHHKMTSKNANMTSLMTHDMAYPLGHQYYQHLSAIAAMAWSDCNQATEKLRRIYEETSNLSRTYDPFGLFSGGIPGYNPQYLSSSPAMGNTANMFGCKDSMLPHADILAARYQQLAEDHNKYLSHAMSQSRTPCIPPTAAPYSTFVPGHQNTPQLDNLPIVGSKSTQQYTLPQEPLPGVAMFDPHYRRTAAQPHPQAEVSMCGARQKRKLCEQPAMQNCTDPRGLRAKYTRLEVPQGAEYAQKLPMTSQSYTTPLFPSDVTINTNSRPPPYDSIVQNSHIPPDASISDYFKMPVPDYQPIVNVADVISKENANDVRNTSSQLIENLKFCLPSVSCSPSQSYASEVQRNVPFVVKQ